MIADSERREVARRLRELERGVMGTCIPAGDLTTDILKAIGYGNSAAMTPYGLLADLIDPGEPEVRCVAEVKVDEWRIEELAHDAVVEVTGIDRDALLALADEMDRDGKIQRTRQKDGEHWFVDGLDVREYARRIRESLGVDDED